MGATGSGGLLPELGVLWGGLAVRIAAAQGPPLLQHKHSSNAEKILSQNSYGSNYAINHAYCKVCARIMTEGKSFLRNSTKNTIQRTLCNISED
jgi:hypothetical protein